METKARVFVKPFLTNRPLMEVVTLSFGRKGYIVRTDNMARSYNMEGLSGIEEVISYLASNGFVEVRSDFDKYDVEHLRELRTSGVLSQEWANCWNEWIEALR